MTILLKTNKSHSVPGFITLPLWAIYVFFLFTREHNKTKKAYEAMISKWNDAPRSAEMFDRLELIARKKIVFEQDGEFRIPKNFRIFCPFYNQTIKFYNLICEQKKWLENKVYPTAEELGIPPEEFEFVRSQMTEEDYKDLDDPDWYEFEKEFIINPHFPQSPVP